MTDLKYKDGMKPYLQDDDLFWKNFTDVVRQLYCDDNDMATFYGQTVLYRLPMITRRLHEVGDDYMWKKLKAFLDVTDSSKGPSRTIIFDCTRRLMNYSINIL